MPVSDGFLQQKVQEITQDAEDTRRARSLRRYEIYRDGGRRFLIEQIKREFGDEGAREMRLAPINLLKKIVNKKASLYRKPAMRRTELESDQALVDAYTEAWGLDVIMQKANRYWELDSNTVLYLIPRQGEVFDLRVMPAYLYSACTEERDPLKAFAYIFSPYGEKSQAAPDDDLKSATGREGWNRQRGVASAKGNAVDSNERRITNQPEFFIYWSDDEHFTLDQDGNKVPLDPEKGDEQFINPTGVMPVITIQKDRDDEYWATQGEDMVDLTIAAQLGWSDLLTIAKHQGFSLLTIGSEEEPTSQEIGLNKAIWLKLKEGSPTPFVEYAQASSPIEQYKQMILDLIGMMLSTNDMNPKELAGALNAQSVTSGAQALIEMADTLEAREESKPVFRDAEKELWDTLAAWHNWAHDIQGMLPPDLQALGKFSEGFTVSIQYQDIKPIESEQERLMVVEKLRNMGLITKLDAIKKLNPDLSDDEIEAKLEEIKEESMAQAAAFGLPAPSEEEEPAEEEEDGTEES